MNFLNNSLNMKGKEFKRLLKSLVLTQDDAAKSLNRTRRTIINWCNSEEIPYSESKIIAQLKMVAENKFEGITDFVRYAAEIENRQLLLENKELKKQIRDLQRTLHLQSDIIYSVCSIISATSLARNSGSSTEPYTLNCRPSNSLSLRTCN